jgi:L-alanine-DL-glutamate epimerase-like enolase superfamily enzyme
MMRSLIKEITVRATDIPMKELFQTARSQTAVAPNVTVTLTLENGIIGYGGATAMSYVTGESRETLLETIPQISQLLSGQDVRNYRQVGSLLTKHFESSPGARASVEIALFDAIGKQYGVPLWQFFGGSQNEVITDVTIPITSSERAEQLAKEAARAGFRYLKLKVGSGDEEADFERVMAIHRGAPQAAIRLDANQGFSPDEAIQFMKRVSGAGITLDLVEQPVEKTDLNGLKIVRDAGIAPIAADEAIVHPEDAFKIAAMHAADVINIKLMKCGVLGALDIISICKRAGLGLMLGCMLESRIGMAMAAHLACGAGGFRYLDLDAHLLAAEEIAVGGFTQIKDVMVPSDESGLGCQPCN